MQAVASSDEDEGGPWAMAAPAPTPLVPEGEAAPTISLDDMRVKIQWCLVHVNRILVHLKMA